MWESCRGFGKLICKNVDNAGEGLPQFGRVWSWDGRYESVYRALATHSGKSGLILWRLRLY